MLWPVLKAVVHNECGMRVWAVAGLDPRTLALAYAKERLEPLLDYSATAAQRRTYHEHKRINVQSVGDRPGLSMRSYGWVDYGV